MTAGALAALPFDVFTAFAVFVRVGAFFMAAPAFGDLMTPPRFRLAAALALSAALAPVAAAAYPAPPSGPAGMALLLLGETAAGAGLGLLARIFASALNVAGQIIALQMGLSLAQAFDPTQGLQGAFLGAFLAILGTTLVFVTDLHHLLIGALAQSYALAPPGLAFPAGDFSAAAISALGAAFSLGLRLAAPFVLFGLVFHVGAGLLNRLMPQAQVFFMLAPANLMLGLMLLMLTIGLMMTVYLDAFEAFLVGLGG